MRLSKRIHTIKWIALILVILLYVIPIPINKTFDAIEIKLDDPSYIVPCKIKVYGKYYKNLFTDDYFNGHIIVSNYKLTNEKMRKVYFLKDGCPLEYYYDTGRYDSYGNKIYEEYILGHLYSKTWFRRMTISVYRNNALNKEGNGKINGNWGGWSTIDGYCIVTNATTREEAINILLKNKVIP